MRRKEVEDKLAELHKKYDDLVWYARSDPSSVPASAEKAVLDKLARIQKTYPDECKELVGTNSAWQHGFHSGVMAGLRLALGLVDSRASINQFAIDSFPDLDT